MGSFMNQQASIDVLLETLGGVSTGFSQPILTENWLRGALIVDTRPVDRRRRDGVLPEQWSSTGTYWTRGVRHGDTTRSCSEIGPPPLAVLGTFAPDGPPQLLRAERGPIQRRRSCSVHRPAMDALGLKQEHHPTPAGKTQPFT